MTELGGAPKPPGSDLRHGDKMVDPRFFRAYASNCPQLAGAGAFKVSGFTAMAGSVHSLRQRGEFRDAVGGAEIKQVPAHSMYDSQIRL
jgi:hypothetical protein